MVLRLYDQIGRDAVDTLRQVIAEEKCQIVIDLTGACSWVVKPVRFFATSEGNGIELRKRDAA
jgi:hypothetical protein